MVEHELEWNYDGPLERVSAIRFCQTAAEINSTISEMIELTTREALKNHPGWIPITAAKMAPFISIANMIRNSATGPTPVKTFAIGEPKLYEELHLRYFCFDRIEGTLTDTLLACGALSQEVSDYLAKLGT